MLKIVVPAILLSLGMPSAFADDKHQHSPVPTYAADVAPILNERCVSCHSDSHVAPFSLAGYKKALQFSKTIAFVTSKRLMPPWKADLNYGEFKEIPVLTDAQIAVLKRWADAGAPEGDLTKVPVPPPVTTDWRIGKPDLVLTPDRATRIPAEGRDFYRDYLVDPHITKQTWVRGVDFRPSGKNTVHHVIPLVISKEAAEKCRKIKFDNDDNSWEQDSLEAIDTGNKTLGFWSTGAPPILAPEDTGFLLNPGDCIILDMHYKTTGRVEQEHTQVGLYFADKAPAKELSVDAVAALGIYVQPGEAAARVYAIKSLRKETTLYAVWPHMHYIGRTFKAWVKYPKGYGKPLVCINDWDPDWQLLYYYKKPLTLPAGSKIYITGTFDNSTKNARNPNTPPKVVESGASSKDEMLQLYMYVTVKKDPAATKNL